LRRLLLLSLKGLLLFRRLLLLSNILLLWLVNIFFELFTLQDRVSSNQG
jgi:hypothetical protein